MKTIRKILLVMGMVLPLHLLHAQTVLAGSFNGIAAPGQSAPPDSIVQVTAEAQGLPLLPPEEVPLSGTFWWVMPGGSAVPAPCPPLDLSAPIYQIADGQFLVDETGGQVEVVANTRTSSLQAASTVSAVTSALEAQATVLVSLITRVQNTAANQQARAMGMDVPFPGDDGGTNSFTPDGANYLAPDYGTNVWIAHVAVSSGNLTGIGTNTLAKVQYEIQSRTNLLQSDWQSEGSILGSALTNWTPLSVAQIGRTNLFIRLKSWASSDASGLPDWWELEYFGTTGINPNAQDPAGDGWSNWQKFQMGLNPNVFYTPPAPRGVTASLNQANNTATVNWLPSSGAVAGYMVEKTDSGNYPPTVQDFTVSASVNSLANDISGDIPDIFNGNSYDVSYRVQALYSGGNSAWSASVPLQPTTVSGWIIPGTNGLAYLAVSGLPANAVSVRLVYIDWWAADVNNDNSFNFNHDIPVSAFTNGLYQLPASWMPPANDAYGSSSYQVSVKTIDVNGKASAATLIYAFTGSGNEPAIPHNWGMPFYDNRVQMKQNLVFQLRAASMSIPFHFFIPYIYSGNCGDNFGAYTGPYTYPTNYAYAGLFQYANPVWTDVNQSQLDPFLPVEENCLFRNFAFTPADVDENGNLATGVYMSGGLLYWGQGPFYMVLPYPPSYYFQTNWTSFPVLLGDTARWFFYDQADPSDNIWDDGMVSWDNNYDLSMSGNLRNWFGLPYLSVNVAYQKYDGDWNPLGLVTNVVSAGTTHTFSENDFYSINWNQDIYFETAKPQFQIAEYDFWRAAIENDSTVATIDPLPGSPAFSPTNASRLMIAGVGDNTFQIAGYAKLAVTNAYPGVYAYLGQYFDMAYQIDTNGNVTTNPTGILSPYGQFFATQPGPVALVTMPDVDTGARGTGIVSCISVNLNKSKSGGMDLSFNGPDATTPNSPYIFFANNNYDRLFYDADDSNNYEDDVKAACNPGTSVPQPDCNYSNRLANGYTFRAIPTKRDLEDFTRLWVCGITTNLIAALPSGSTITLNWGDVGNPNPGNPTIDLFTAADADGGIGYLTNETIAATQTNIFQCPYIGRLGPGGSIQLNTIQFANGWAGNHFIWCGVSNGTGGLNLTIADGSGNVLAQSTAYIQIVDIKQIYERWTVGDNPTNVPASTPVLVTDGLAAGVPGFQYTASTDTNTPYILFVHGWNMEPWEKDRFAETAFKRLYWQGYQGRFGSFRWPTDYDFTGDFSQFINNPDEKDNFDNSEHNAWLSAPALLNKLNGLNAQYPGHVYVLAHSMGNIVAGEALRLAGSNQVVNTYVASQAAVVAHTYDATVPDYSFAIGGVYIGPRTPNIYGNWFANNNGGGAGHVINFYNTNDFALANGRWQTDEIIKPDTSVLEGTDRWNYRYNGSVNDPAPWNHFFRTNYTSVTVNFDIVNNLNNRYEVMAYAAQAHTTALGATPGVLHLTGNVDLASSQNPQIWPPDNSTTDPNKKYSAHFWHSAEFRGDYALMQGYWIELLGNEAFNLK